MTINVGLVTSEAVILGCDSIASATELRLEPLQFLDRDGEGNYIHDEQGRMIARFKFPDLEYVVTDAWGGVTKMFTLCGGSTPCAAVTAGLAKLKGRNIAAIAHQFTRLQLQQPYASVEQVVSAFADHIGAQYEAHYEETGQPPEFRTDIEFLVGGFGWNDNFPSLYRVNLVHPAAQRVTKVYGVGDGFDALTGIAWAGQADGVERLLFGYDRPLRSALERELATKLDTLHNQMSARIVEILAAVLTALNAELPQDVNTELPPREALTLQWDQLRSSIDFANLPLQDAVDLVAYMVNVQSGKSKFVRGVPTVGGRTHVSVIDRNGFRMLNEPELVHRNVGYARDL